MSARELITEHLDLWTGAVKKKSISGRGSNGKLELTGVKKLRKLILELAVRGKLVEQCPADTSAEQLLERIAGLRKELIASKRIKNSNPLPTVTPVEAPSKLPAGWAWTRLGSIAEINPRNTGVDTLEASFIPMPLVNTSYHGEHGDEPRNWGEIKKGYSHFANGDIGLAKITPCFENSKAAVFRNLRNGIGAGTTELHVARPLSSVIDPYFLLLFLKSPRFLAEGEKVMTGSAGQKRVPKDYFAETPLPLPPQEEQYLIVNKVHELMTLCDRLEQQTSDQLETHETLVDTLLGTLTQSESATELADNWARLAAHFDTLFTTEQSIDKLKQTILQLAVMGRLAEQSPNDTPAPELLNAIQSEKDRILESKRIKKFKELPPVSAAEEPYKIPSGWMWSRIGSVALYTEYGTSAKTLDSIHGIPVVKMGDIQEGKVLIGGQKHAPKSTEGIHALLLQQGDLLYNRTNSPELVGKTGIFRGPDDTLSFASYLIRIKVEEPLLSSNFLNLAMNSPRFRETEINPHLKQQCGQANVNGTILKQMRVPLPPREEQTRIVQKVDELMALCDQLKECLNQASETRCQLAEAEMEGAMN